jgi:hypothetical protein
MNENEFLPIISGIVLGSILGFLKPKLRLSVGAVLVILLGILATVASGEFEISWGFLLIDIPLVAVSAAIALFAVHRLRWSRSH